MVASGEGSNNIFFLPDLGEGLEDAELIQWCVDPGQQVQENDILAKMETAKALVDVPSPRAGVVATLHGQPGQTIKVGSPLVTFKSPKAAEPTIKPSQSEVEARKDAGSVVGNLADSEVKTETPQAAPAVRRMARDLGIDLATVHGTGIGGRITAHDVQAIHAEPSERSNTNGTKPAARRTSKAGANDEPADTDRIPFRGVRRTIAEHLRYSVAHAVHYTLMDEADVSALDALRRKLMAASNEKISLLPFVAFAVCRVLAGQRGKMFARLNSTVDDDKQEIVQHRSVHLGIATDTEVGLMVPVIRDAAHLGVLEISRRIGQVAHAARERKLSPDQLTGSTFTLSNIGPMGGRFGTPIINYPEAGILAIGRAREGVVVRDGMLGVGKLLPLSLSADHRVIDGATAAAAMAKIIDLLQSPDELLPSTKD